MKYIFTTLLAIIVISFVPQQPTFAKLNLGKNLTTNAATKAGYDPGTNEKTLAEIIGTVIKAVLSLAGVLFTFLIAYAGDMWMGARGNQEAIDKAKQIIIGSIIGLIVSLAAYTISNFAVNAVLDRATGQGEMVNPDSVTPPPGPPGG